jgi:hypothetical protein
MAAARLPPRSEPQKSQDLRPRALPLRADSATLLGALDVDFVLHRGVDKERSAGVTPTAYLQDRTGLTIGRI